jgi:hypothetical protein
MIALSNLDEQMGKNKLLYFEHKRKRLHGEEKESRWKTFQIDQHTKQG